MSYYFNKTLSGVSFERAVERVSEVLKTEDFGVLTQVDIKQTFKKKLNVDFRNYMILGACNPDFAYKAIQSENKIGVFLPCNIVIEELDGGKVEVSAVDPIASMISVKNDALGPIAIEVQEKLKRVIKNL